MDCLHYIDNEWHWNSEKIKSIKQQIYVLHNGYVNIFYQKPFSNNYYYYYDAYFAISCFGVGGDNRITNDNTHMICNYCLKYELNLYSIFVTNEFIRMCKTCHNQAKNRKGEIFVNDKYPAANPRLEILTRENKKITGYHKLLVKESYFNFLEIICIPWFVAEKNDICQLCHQNKKHNNYACKQCYYFAFDLLYQEYQKLLPMKVILISDVYYYIHGYFLYLIDYNIGENYRKYSIKTIKIVEK